MFTVLLSYYAGEYAGFNEDQPTCRDNGKAVVIQQLKDKFGYRRLVHIGDGVTDLEACPPAVSLSPVFFTSIELDLICSGFCCCCMLLLMLFLLMP